MIFKLFHKYLKTFLWAMAILIIPSFVLWGVGSGVRGHRQAQEAGRIFNHPVTWNDYEASYRAIQMFLSLSNLQAYAQFLNPVDLTWDRLILLHEAKRRQLSVPNEEVIAYIQNVPLFRTGGESGKEGEGAFDVKRYEEILHRAFRTTSRSFEEEIRKTLILTKLRDDVAKEVSLDETALKEEYKKSHDKRKVSYIQLAIQNFEKDVTVTEENLASYYASHKSLFKRPEEVRVAFVTADFGKKSKEDVVALMDKVSDELLAEDLEKVATAHGLSVQETGFFGLEDPLPAPGFSYELSKAAFALEVGKISDPIRTKTGVTLLKLLEKRPPHILSLEEAHPEVEKITRKEKAEGLCRQKTEETLRVIQKKMGEEKMSWEEAVKSLGLALNESPFFTQEGYVEKLGVAPLLTQAAFALALKEVGGVVQVPDGFAILRVEAEEPFSEEAFLKEKEAFGEKLLKQKQAEFYLEWFKALRTNAHLVSNVTSSQRNLPEE